MASQEGPASETESFSVSGPASEGESIFASGPASLAPPGPSAKDVQAEDEVPCGHFKPFDVQRATPASIPLSWPQQKTKAASQPELVFEAESASRFVSLSDVHPTSVAAVHVKAIQHIQCRLIVSSPSIESNSNVVCLPEPIELSDVAFAPGRLTLM
jgi:hypothetical protein